jgi:methyl-accepting chemotaxis protein
LALINQALLHVAGRRAESLRMSARMWFDSVIWSHIGLDTQAATVKAVHALEQFATSMTGTAVRHTAIADQIDKSTASINNAASAFRDVVHAFSGEIKGVPEALCDVRNATTASASALEELIQVGSRAVSNLDVSVAAFRTTLDRDFATAAKLHFRSSNVFAESVQQVCDAIVPLKSGSDELRLTTQVNAASLQGMDESIRQHVVPAMRQFYEAVQTLTGQAAVLDKATAALTSKVEAVGGQFDHIAGRLEPSVRSLCEVLDSGFGPAVTQHVGQVESVTHTLQQLEQMANNMSAGTDRLNVALTDVSEFLSQSQTSLKELAIVASNLAKAGQGLRQSVESDIAPAQRKMNDAANSFAASATQLSDFMRQGVGPATRQLAKLHETLAGLEQVVESIERFSDTRSDIDRLSDALAHAADISDAISSLPEQIREIIEQSCRHDAAISDSRSSLRTWISKWPK